MTKQPTRPAFPGDHGAFHGFAMAIFSLEGRECRVVVPHREAVGRPWIWRARFFGHEPQVDISLLQHGYHLAYIDVIDLLGSPRAVSLWDRFYAYLTGKHGFAPRPALEGMSRGGLIVYHWAAANPDKVSCIYADAPVCDIRSWPAGKGAGEGNPALWQRCLELYGLTEEAAETVPVSPIDRLVPLAAVGVPLLHVVGDLDRSVPVAENTAVLEKRYRAMGGSMEVIHKPEGGHHPHSLEDPEPIVSFILSHGQGKETP